MQVLHHRDGSRLWRAAAWDSGILPSLFMVEEETPVSWFFPELFIAAVGNKLCAVRVSWSAKAAAGSSLLRFLL